MTWRVAYSLDVLRDQINARYPGRDVASDGSIGDATHSAEGTGSDHNPDQYGIVRARDFDSDAKVFGNPGDQVVEHWLAPMLLASRDPRIKYVIADGRIFYGSEYWAESFEGPGHNAWTWYPYYGDDLHVNHLHLSVVPSAAADNRTAWNLGNVAPTPRKGHEMARLVRYRKSKDPNAVYMVMGPGFSQRHITKADLPGRIAWMKALGDDPTIIDVDHSFGWGGADITDLMPTSI